MSTISRRRFLQLSAMAGGALAFGDLADQVLGLTRRAPVAHAAEPIKVGIIDPLSSPYKTSSIHDVHGATVALEMYNKRGGVLGRPVSIIEADDASNLQTAIKMANKLIKEDHVDFLMGTFNGDVALAVADVAKQQNRLFMATCPHIMDLTGAHCSSHTFVFMPNARMMAQAVASYIVKVHGSRWYMITADTVDGKAALQAMMDALKALNGEVVGAAVTPFGTTDFTAALTEAKAAKPSVVILN
ncbi:MAG: ABC transporter substrate-binding protein, partial [Nitrospiraceae bacterium]